MIKSLQSNLTQDATGTWRTNQTRTLAYPDGANDRCFALEEKSFWFHYRNQIIQSIVEIYPPDGPFIDVGGGNGFVAQALQAMLPGSVYLLEPNEQGIRNAVSRGVKNRIWGTLEDVRLADNCVAGIGLFDVLEHIPNESDFLSEIHRCLGPDGYLYITVPAYEALWTALDTRVGHQRRHTRNTLNATLEANGFAIRHTSYFFSWMLLPHYILMKLATNDQNTSSRKTNLLSLPHEVLYFFYWELFAIRQGWTIPFGSSLLSVAQPIKSHLSK
jgi:SAM-dependent methyltransferase